MSEQTLCLSEKAMQIVCAQGKNKQLPQNISNLKKQLLGSHLRSGKGSW